MTERLPDGPFASFAALRQAHNDLWADWRVKPIDESERVATIERFLALASAAGRVIGDEADRQRAQGILDLWAVELITASPVDAQAWSAPRLEPFAAAGTNVDDTEREESEPGHRASTARERLRLAATARQWRDSDFQPGYLLTGSALAEADTPAFRGFDDVVDALIAASRKAAGRSAVRWRWALFGLIAFLVAVSITLFLFWREAEDKRASALESEASARREQDVAVKARQLADEQRQAAEAARRAADEEAETLKAERAAADEERRAALTAAESALARLAELENTQRRLDASLGVLRTALASGAIEPSAVPEELRRAAAAPETPVTPDLVTADAGALTGYRPDFLNTDLPLPLLSGAVAETAFAGGRPLDYANYSIVLNQTRRMALVSASNLNRSALLVLPRTADGFRTDPRVPDDMQPEAGWFADNDLDTGHLVTRQEVAWGSYFNGNREAAAQRLAGIVNLYPNATPQFDTLNRGIWSTLERWVLTRHNPSASRVTVFSGPVLANDDPVLGEVRVPRLFFKIAVSEAFTRAGGLVADAFLVPQFAEGTDEKIDLGSVPLDVFRVDIAEIEALTGLDFGEALRAAGTARLADLDRQEKAAATPDESVTAQVARLDSPAAAERRAATQSILDRLRDPDEPEALTLERLEALIALAGTASTRGLTTSGRYNLLFVLADIPAALWNRTGFLDAKAAARRAVAEIERRAAEAGAGDPFLIRADTRRLLDALKDRLGFAPAPPYTAYLQFAGMTREDAEAVGRAMDALGWRVPGEERIAVAAGRNEVRYGDPKDEAAAKLLAADLRAAGREGVVGVQRIPAIKRGLLEIWISE